MQQKFFSSISRHRYTIGAVAAIICMVVAGLVVWHQIKLAEQRAGKIAVPVYVAPSDATVKLSDNTELPTSGTAYLRPGEYEVTVSRDGFASQTRDLRVSENATPYIYIGLASDSEEADAWQKANRAAYAKIESLTVEKAREYNTLFKSNNPIVNVLPIQDPYYTVDYRNHDDASIELLIYGVSPQYREVALEFLRDKGYEPTDYRIVYENFKNPLGGEQ